MRRFAAFGEVFFLAMLLFAPVVHFWCLNISAPPSFPVPRVRVVEEKARNLLRAKGSHAYLLRACLLAATGFVTVKEVVVCVTGPKHHLNRHHPTIFKHVGCGSVRDKD